MLTLATRPTQAKVAIIDGPAVAHEGQRDAGDGHDPEGHADVLEDLEREHRQDPDAHQHAEEVAGQTARCATSAT